MIRIAVSLIALLAAAPGARAECAPLEFADADYTVCRVELAQDELRFFNLDADGMPFGSFAALRASLAGEGKTLGFAMNGGMYDDNQMPIGLYVEDGKEAKKLNRRNGAGNFHLKPNGVFYVKGGKAGVVDTERYARLKLKPDYATQSGPMLVIDGRIHPAFSPEGTSRKARNGVGVVDADTVVFAISEGGVRFHDFARLFRDELGCKNALFLDGTISSLHAPELGRSDSGWPLGPIIAVVK